MPAITKLRSRTVERQNGSWRHGSGQAHGEDMLTGLAFQGRALIEWQAAIGHRLGRMECGQRHGEAAADQDDCMAVRMTKAAIRQRPLAAVSAPAKADRLGFAWFQEDYVKTVRWARDELSTSAFRPADPRPDPGARPNGATQRITSSPLAPLGSAISSIMS